MRLSDPQLLRQHCYVDGRWAGAASGATLEVRNPATGEAVGSVPAMGGADTRCAIGAAHAALPAWRARTAGERAAILKRLHALMLAHQDDLAVIMTTEQGKPLRESRGEIGYAASFVEWFAEEARRI